ncbi:hypothetical protein [Acinetobacter pittii]|uniref:hypothetical protein n=1 Tax=Acinetobacter pittii TaxID=48296 RepID=UPI00094D294D|nr:hypothetical protein [Acinetobacter pittii]
MIYKVGDRVKVINSKTQETLELIADPNESGIGVTFFDSNRDYRVLIDGFGKVHWPYDPQVSEEIRNAWTLM